MNLTLTTLASTTKYPRTAAEAVRQSKRKFGYFQTEAALCEQIRSTLNLKEGQRHPIVYLVEAADDSAYCLSDIEDAIEKGLVQLDDLWLHLAEAFGENVALSRLLKTITKPYNYILTEQAHPPAASLPTDQRPETLPFLSPLQEFRGGAIRLFTSGAATCYLEHHEDIIRGDLHELIRDGTTEGTLLNGLKSFAVKNLYGSQIVRSREITANTVLHGILNAHRQILLCDEARFCHALSGALEDDHEKPITVEASLLSRFPRKLVTAYRNAQCRPANENAKWREWMDRAHLIVDYVSGMTDEHALETYQLISGMRTDSRL